MSGLLCYEQKISLLCAWCVKDVLCSVLFCELKSKIWTSYFQKQVLSFTLANEMCGGDIKISGTCDFRYLEGGPLFTFPSNDVPN